MMFTNMIKTAIIIYVLLGVQVVATSCTFFTRYGQIKPSERIMKKKCRKCDGIKLINEFHKNNKRKIGFVSVCKKCCKEKWRTKDGLISRIYYNQRHSSKVRNHPMPCYTLNEFKIWIKKQKSFYDYYNKWVMSDYKKELTPSCDRLDDYKPYTFDNIRLTVWINNKKKSHNDRVNGINNKSSKSVIQFNINGDFINKYYSIKQAERETSIDNSHIVKCCQGKRKTAGKYIWRYA